MKKYEVVVIGAGITGSALVYELAKYTDIKNIAIVEKYNNIGTLNSNPRGNSQTIHSGAIETNYNLDKTLETKTTSDMVVKYCLKHGYKNDIIFSQQKMAMGVGEKEVEFIKKRYDLLSKHFKSIELWNKEELRKIEPNVVMSMNGSDRDEDIMAIGSQNEWSAVDFGKMSVSLIENAKSIKGKNIDLFLNSPVLNIHSSSDGSYEIETNTQKLHADFVVVNAGAYSLYFAHKMGYGMQYGCLPIAGSFFVSHKRMLNGKVYMVQNDKLPFAALHGDPDITLNGATRFGPTAIMLPKLERYKKSSFIDFWKTLKLDRDVMSILVDVLKDKDVREFIIKNAIYETPLLSKAYFTKQARKIIPSLSIRDIKHAKGFGGIRPQVLDKKNKKLLLGEASINTNKGIIFNMTPSPGATSCLGNGIKDVETITSYLNKTFYADNFKEDFLT